MRPIQLSHTRAHDKLISFIQIYVLFHRAAHTEREKGRRKEGDGEGERNIILCLAFTYETHGKMTPHIAHFTALTTPYTQYNRF